MPGPVDVGRVGWRFAVLLVGTRSARDSKKNGNIKSFVCLSKFPHCFVSALTFKSCQNNPENLSIHFAVSAGQGKWLDISVCGRREM